MNSPYHNVDQPGAEMHSERVFNGSALRGTMMMQHASDEGLAVPAQPGGVLLGCLTRDVQDGGPDLGDLLYPGRLELAGEPESGQSYEPADQITMEGAEFIKDSGTGALNVANIATKIPGLTLINFENGKAREAQPGERADYVLAEVLQPVEPGRIRIRIRKL